MSRINPGKAQTRIVILLALMFLVSTITLIMTMIGALVSVMLLVTVLVEIVAFVLILMYLPRLRWSGR